MSLLQLPAEILIHIFDYVGSNYFRSDLSRLRVCKQWIKYAYTVCYRDFHVTQQTLRRLVSCPHVESILPLIKNTVETVGIDLEGYEDCHTIPLFLTFNSHSPRFECWDDWNEFRRTWAAQMNTILLSFATILQQSRKLRTLRIKASGQVTPTGRLSHSSHYLFYSTIRVFLSASSLTTLELDLYGTGLNEDVETVHACPTIAALLTTLRRLRLRMRSICPAVLKPLQGCTDLHLNEVLINLSLANESPLTNKERHARLCGLGVLRGMREVPRLKAAMEKQAQILVTQMESPRIVRILTHSYPKIEMRAFDALTGRTVRLSEGADWDDDGENIEDKVSEEESSSSSIP